MIVDTPSPYAASMELARQARQMREHIAGELAGVQLLPGTFITAKALHPGRHWNHVAWIMNHDGCWYETGDSQRIKTDDLILELARLALSNDEFQWEIVGVHE